MMFTLSAGNNCILFLFCCFIVVVVVGFLFNYLLHVCFFLMGLIFMIMADIHN
jgi:hypothetical protein